MSAKWRPFCSVTICYNYIAFQHNRIMLIFCIMYLMAYATKSTFCVNHFRYGSHSLFSSFPTNRSFCQKWPHLERLRRFPWTYQAGHKLDPGQTVWEIVKSGHGSRITWNMFLLWVYNTMQYYFNKVAQSGYHLCFGWSHIGLAPCHVAVNNATLGVTATLN